MFTIQLFKSKCHPNHCIHHSDRQAKQNDKNLMFLNTILTTGLVFLVNWWRHSFGDFFFFFFWSHGQHGP